MFLHINNTMVILLKTASVRVSSIQIMQVRVQNKGKSVWKSRYDRDVSREKKGGRDINLGKIAGAEAGTAQHWREAEHGRQQRATSSSFKVDLLEPI